MELEVVCFLLLLFFRIACNGVTTKEDVRVWTKEAKRTSVKTSL